MTYMTAMARDIDVKADTANEHKFSTKWTYNMVNGGADAGSWLSDAYDVMLTSGAATLADLPYDSNYTAWVYKTTASYHGNTKTAAQVWREAIANRMDQTGTVTGLDTDAGLTQLKTLLTDGYVLNYATDIYGWQFKAMGDDPSTSDDDGYAGKQGCYAAVASNSGHAMTIVGYDDSIWMDINSDGLVDLGEKGALKIANSWGTSWQNAGFTWVSYDALKSSSAVSGWSQGNRQAVFWYASAYWITARQQPYVPTLLAEFTLQHGARSQMGMSVGLGAGGSSPTSTWTPSVLSYDGGSLGFDGLAYANSASAPVGQFVIDMTDMSPNLSQVNRYFLSMDDSVDSNHRGTILSFNLTDAAGNVLGVCPAGPLGGELPQVTSDVPGSPARAYMDYPATGVRGLVFSDKDNDSVRDAGEPALSGLTVFLDQNGNSLLDTQVSTFSSSGELPIPARTTLRGTLDVSGLVGTLSDVNVTLNISFPRDSDLTITLVSPSGARVMLVEHIPSTGANFVNTVLDDQATTSIASAQAPFTGTFKPYNPLNALNEEDGNGTWTLEIRNSSKHNSGTLNSWSLQLSTSEVTAWTDSSGNYALTRLPAGEGVVRLLAPVGFTPTLPAGGSYTETIVGQQSLTGRDFGLYTLPPTVTQAALAVVNLAGMNAALSVRANDDGGEDKLTYAWSVVSQPAGGGATFSPNGANAAKDSSVSFAKGGSYTLRATITDAGGQTATSDVTFVVNHLPQATGEAYAVDEDALLSVLAPGVLANDSDSDGDALAARLVQDVAHGTLSLNANGSFTYSPLHDFFGQDSFTYVANDGRGDSQPATVTITVNPVNDAPTLWLPSPQSLVQGGRVTFFANGGNGIAIGDVDSGAGLVQVDLTASDGTITLGGTAGLTFLAGDGADDAILSFQGALAAVNAALEEMSYRAGATAGAAQIQIVVSDLGNTGSGGPQIASGAIELTVKTILAGDVNRDGAVSFADYQLLEANFGKAGQWEQGDLSGDGWVSFADYQILEATFGKSV